MWLINSFLAYYQTLYNAVGSLVGRVFNGRAIYVPFHKKQAQIAFKVGQTVITRHGNIGKIIQIYRSKDTNEALFASIAWIKPKDKELTLLFPLKDIIEAK